MAIEHSRTLARAGLLLFMFALGVTLVVLLKPRPAPPQAAAPALPQAGPETPSQVVTAYWRLALKRDIAGANKYWFREISKGEIVHVEEVRDDDMSWATVISIQKLRLTGIVSEIPEADGSVTVTVKTNPDGAPRRTMYACNTLKKFDGEWKIVAFDWPCSAGVR
jgi:hypothetical protein